jgi:hypothetical protein
VGLLAVDTIARYRLPTDVTAREPRVSTAYRPSKISPFYWCFVATRIRAVDAVDVFLSLCASFFCMYPCAEAKPMHLASDYIHPCEDAGGRLAYCRVRIYLPDEAFGA